MRLTGAVKILEKCEWMMDVVQVSFLLNLSQKALLILEWFRFSVIRMLNLIEGVTSTLG